MDLRSSRRRLIARRASAHEALVRLAEQECASLARLPGPLEVWEARASAAAAWSSWAQRRYR